MVGISAFEPGAQVAGRYRVVERLTRFAVTDQVVSGVEFEYWLAVDEIRRTEVWLQAALCGDAVADGAALAGAVAAIRRLSHPAIPAVLDFGEVEVPALIVRDSVVDVEAEFEFDEEELVSQVGYAVLAPVEGESLAAALLRGTLTEAESLAVLAEVAEVLELLHETELVHGHLSAYSIVLTETGVLVIDLAVALAVEAAVDSELTIAADVYALAWLACVTLVGVEVIEAEFGEGFLVSEAGDLALEGLALELVARRRRWAEANLVAAFGLTGGLAELLISGLGEASVRPPAASLTAAFRGRPIPAPPRRGAHAAGGRNVRPAVTGAILVGAVAEAGMAAAMETSAVETAAVETAAVETAAVETTTIGMAGYGSAALETGGASAQTTEATAGMSGAAVGAEEFGIGLGAGVGAGVLAGVGAGGIGGGGSGGGAAAGSAVGSAGAETTIIPRVASAGSGSGYVPTAPVSQSAVALARRRERGPVLLLGIGLALILVVGLVWVLFGHSKHTVPLSAAQSSSPTAPAGGGASGSATTAPAVAATASAQASQSAGAGGGLTGTASASPGAGITITPPAATVGAGLGATSPTSPLATAPGSPQQAVQQIQQLVTQASSTLPKTTVAELNDTLAALRQEIGSASSTVSSSSQLNQIISGTGFPTGLAGQIEQLIPYLSSFGGS